MMEHYFTTADREEQLQKFMAALSRLIEHLQRESNLAASAAPYEAVLALRSVLNAGAMLRTICRRK